MASQTQRIMHEAAPTGAVTVFFHDESLTLRFCASGSNEGWWWEGDKISLTRAQEVVAERTIRAIVKS